MADAELTLAVFIDFENLALAFPSRSKVELDINLILGRLVEKGKVIVKKSYSDWDRYPRFKKAFHECAIELIEIPKRSMTGKNSADIRMVVDAMDLSYSKDHINAFCIVSGDSDFSPLVSKLKENGKHVIGMGMKGSTSNLLADNCDEFIFYEDLVEEAKPEKVAPRAKGKTGLPAEKAKAFQLLLRSSNALVRENKDVLYASMVKDTMKRMNPSFSESSAGYKSFSELLEAAAQHGIIALRTDDGSGTYVVAPPARRPGRRGGSNKRS